MIHPFLNDNLDVSLQTSATFSRWLYPLMHVKKCDIDYLTIRPTLSPFAEYLDDYSKRRDAINTVTRQVNGAPTLDGPFSFLFQNPIF